MNTTLSSQEKIISTSANDLGKYDTCILLLLSLNKSRLLLVYPLGKSLLILTAGIFEDWKRGCWFW